MTSPGVARPKLAPGPQRDLVYAIHDSYQLAGCPSVRDIWRSIDKELSTASIHQFLSLGKIPRNRDTVLKIVTFLAEKAGLRTVEQSDAFKELWLAWVRGPDPEVDLPDHHANEVSAGGESNITMAGGDDRLNISDFELGPLRMNFPTARTPPMLTVCGELVPDELSSYHMTVRGKRISGQRCALIFGPFQRLVLRGEYNAAFSIRVEHDTSDQSDEALEIDVFDVAIEYKLATRSILANELQTDYQRFDLSFEYEDVARPLEYRVLLLHPTLVVRCDLVCVDLRVAWPFGRTDSIDTANDDED